MSTVTITGVSNTRTAKDGRGFFVATFRPGFGQKEVKRTFWQQYRKDKDGNNIPESLYWERATPEEAKALLASGEPIQAEKVTRTVEMYPVQGREVNTYSTVLFPDEKVEVLFEQQGHPMLDETTGELIVRNKKAVISATPIEEGADVPVTK